MSTAETVAPKKLSPFEIADNIYGKTGRLDPVAVGYDPFMMNKIASNNYTDVFFAAELNRYPSLSKEMSYCFYYNALDRGKRYGRWHKSPKSDEIDTIAKAYNVNKIRAAQYHKLLGPDGIAAVLASQATGGRSGARTKTKASK